MNLTMNRPEEVYYMEDYTCVCLLKCNMPEVISLLYSYTMLIQELLTTILIWNHYALIFIYAEVQFVDPGGPPQQVC
jgi:hypothetical protein